MLASLKDRFSQSKVAQAVAAPALALGLTFGAANIANADDSANAQPVSYKNVQVPMDDGRHVSPKAVTFGAIQASRDQLLFVILGKNQSLLDQTYEAAQQLIAAGYPLRGIILGPTDHPEQVDVYTDGQLYDTVSPKAGSSGKFTFYDRNIIKRAAIYGYEDIVKPRLDAKKAASLDLDAQ